MPRSQIQAIDRSVALLDVISRSGPTGTTLRELAERVGLNQSTARTLLSSLSLHGLVWQHGDGRRFRLGPRFFALNQSYVTQTDLPRVAAPILQRLWELTQETVHLSVLHGARRLDISVLVGSHMLNVNPNARADDGSLVPIEQTAAGKVLLAGLGDEALAAIRHGSDWGYFAGTPRPVAAGLRAELDQVREQGFATNLDEAGLGVYGVAAPILDSTDRTVAALCVGYPSARHSDEYLTAMRKAVCDAAREFSMTMGAHVEAGE